MGELARAFVAVFPPPAVVDALDARVARARDAVPALRWAPRAQWHCTLKFLGPVPDAEAVAAALRAAAASVAAVDGVQLAAGGAFPKPRHGSVLWAGFGDADALSPVAAAVEEACGRLGFPAEERPLRAHVTVARASRARDLRVAVAALGDDAIGPAWRVDEIVLVSSDTRVEGAVYEVVERFALGG